ncbi:alpha-L-arabinofuranosidase [Flavobacterium nitrogenifigens]|uniref:non-reducing end alpha-L-arabinofuranosidase n=2 Tax=Flavobacterium TaxID=237 RepID=A0A7W7NAH1_9FLAO|nr:MULTISPECIES: alpha-L-arabinofuranosidase C-terminal domain-containing protein [Flavobacterium]MBB4804514.1 alpha-L-arabinofuranosidase [Flavobacterium nitrogenifigens]MBB6389473.1 alpha-L-arabinofuranosidase [Flavobacterium notoginsengisoli]
MKVFLLRNTLKLFLVFSILFGLSGFSIKIKEENPGKVYLFAYSTLKNNGKNGLHFAWSTDQKNWFAIGPEFSFLKSDFGSWGPTGKSMSEVFLIQDNSGIFHCFWSVRDNVFAHSESKDLVNWGRQNYIQGMKNFVGKEQDKSIILNVQVSKNEGQYLIHFSESGNNYSCATKDFKQYTSTIIDANASALKLRSEIQLQDEILQGTMHKVDWSLVENMIKNMESVKFRDKQNNTSPKSDSLLFLGLKPINVTIKINGQNSKKISNMLTGVFFEDINYAADGGLYGELIQNRDFEYTLHDRKGSDEKWNSSMAWSGDFKIENVNPIHANNPNYAVIKNGSISNSGFEGIALKANEKYDFSVFAKGTKAIVRLKTASGETLAEAEFTPSNTWKKFNLVLKSSKTVNDAHLEISTNGETAVDMVSLFPQKTFKNRKNGLRADLAETIADMHPKFVRFPGGCVAHGDGLHNIYKWKNTIGPLESRIGSRNIWGYHQSMGLGYFEYFQFCEDLGAEAVPVLAAGVPCQNSSDGGSGQQFGIPMEDMDEYVQDVLDLIEYANGSINTVWGKKRAEAGHPKPFNLKYIGIGNEDLISDVFEERYRMIVKAIQQKHPEIKIIGTVGPFFEGTDYREGWKIADDLKLPLVDEHYYQSPGWFINNHDFYDSYDRSKSKVYLGEYASWGNMFYNALAEALYLTGVERNGDVVSMASYAPLLAREKHTQWNPDLIYFNGNEVKPTVNYFVQKLYGQNPGDIYIERSVKASDNSDVNKRIGVSAVKESISGDLIVKLVNVLPVSVMPSIEIANLATTENTSYTVLSGNPEKTDARPITQNITLKEAISKELPPYSFTVIRIKTKK